MEMEENMGTAMKEEITWVDDTGKMTLPKFLRISIHYNTQANTWLTNT